MVIMVAMSNESTCGRRGSVQTALPSRSVAGKQISGQISYNLFSSKVESRDPRSN